MGFRTLQPIWWPAAPAPVGAFGDHGDAIAHDAGDRTAEELCRSQRVAADIGQRTAACGIMAEGVIARSIGHVIFAMDAAIAANLAQFRSEEHTSELQSQFHLVC